MEDFSHKTEMSRVWRRVHRRDEQMESTRPKQGAIFPPKDERTLRTGFADGTHNMAWVTFPLIGGETGLVTLLGMDRKRTNVTQKPA